MTYFMSLGTGYRHLWQDEVETAERARTILESGYPRVIDKNGVLTLNASGLEIEEGNAHRFGPWVQFYTAALGLYTGNQFDINKDKSVRLPFVFAHGLTASMAYWGSHVLGSVSMGSSILTSLLLSLQTERVLHDRTARYHSLLDFFVVLGAYRLWWDEEKVEVGGASGWDIGSGSSSYPIF